MSDTTLPVHAVTGLAALGWRAPRRGETGPQPIWPIAGAADDDGSDDEDPGEDEPQDDGGRDEPDDDGDGGDPDGADTLGDAGKKALDAMKAKRNEYRDKYRKTREELEQLRKAAEGKDESSADDIRREAEKAAAQKANAKLVRSEIRAAAKGRLADPKDALVFLDPDEFEVDEDGEVDSDEIEDKIEELLKNKPHLAATAKRFQGTGDGGAARKAGKPKQLTRDDVKRMSYDEVAKAQSNGQLADLLAGKKKG